MDPGYPHTTSQCWWDTLTGCSRQCEPEVAGNSSQLYQKLYAQIDELLAPVSTFLQATLMKQVLADYGINPTNTICKSDPILERQLNQICEAILWTELWTICCANQQDPQTDAEAQHVY